MLSDKLAFLSKEATIPNIVPIQVISKPKLVAKRTSEVVALVPFKTTVAYALLLDVMFPGLVQAVPVNAPRRLLLSPVPADLADEDDISF